MNEETGQRLCPDAMQMPVRVVETGSFTRVAHEFTTTQPTGDQADRGHGSAPSRYAS